MTHNRTLTASPPALLGCCNVVSLILGHLSFQINLENYGVDLLKVTWRGRKW